MFASDPRRSGRLRPTSEVTVSEAASHLGITPDRLRDYIRRGCLPSPLYIAGYPAFTSHYLRQLDVDGLCLDGTYDVAPSRWLNSRDPIPPAERRPAPKKKRHPLHGKPGPKPRAKKGGAR